MKRNYKVVQEFINDNLKVLRDKLNHIKESNYKFYDDNEGLIDRLLNLNDIELENQDSLLDFINFENKLKELIDNLDSLIRAINNSKENSQKILILRFLVSRFNDDLAIRSKHLDVEKFYRENKEEFCSSIITHYNMRLKNILREGYNREGNTVEITNKSVFQPKFMPGIVDMTNNEGELPIHLAVKSNNKEAIILLLNYGANIKLTDSEDNNILHVLSGMANEQAKDLLELFLKFPEKPQLSYPTVEFKELINEKNKHGEVPLQILAENDPNPTIQSLAKSFYDLGANIELVDEKDKNKLLQEENFDDEEVNFDIFSLSEIHYDNPYIDYAWKTGETEYMFKGLGLSSEGAQCSQVDDLTQNNKLGEITDMSDGD